LATEGWLRAPAATPLVELSASGLGKVGGPVTGDIGDLGRALAGEI
jgi:hypothetical protein